MPNYIDSGKVSMSGKSSMMVRGKVKKIILFSLGGLFLDLFTKQLVRNLANDVYSLLEIGGKFIWELAKQQLNLG